VSDPDRVVRQAEIANSLIGHLADQVVDPILVDATVHTPPQQLHAVHALTGAPGDDREVVAPLLDLSASDLLVNARGEPALAHALSREIPSADSIDLLCAFVQWHGLRLIEVQLKEHRRLGRPLRVTTTVFTGSTERKALDWLVAQGAEVKVSYETQSTRLAAFYHWHERHSLSLAVCVAIGHPTEHRA
jgi:hypothetical protein